MMNCVRKVNAYAGKASLKQSKSGLLYRVRRTMARGREVAICAEVYTMSMQADQ